MKLVIISIALCFFVFGQEVKTQTIDNTNIATLPNNKTNLIVMVGRKLKNLWTWFQTNKEDTFIGRCFGVARKLKFFMPIMIFKLGVIITILVFLTIFSLKGLGLLVTLLLINTGGIASKFASLKGEHDHKAPAQNLHFHIHQNKDGNYQIGHSGPGPSGWVDRNDESSSSSLELYNLYSKLENNPYASPSRRSNYLYYDSR